METLLSAFRYIFNHVETAVGVSIALILVTGILLLVRMLMEKPASATGAGAQLDVEALEGTLKRVLGQAQGITTQTTSADGAQISAATSSMEPADAARMQALVAEREKMIAELQAALASARTAASEVPAGGGGDAIALLDLQNKVRDLEARLAEYSIIEDDIADLSMYKDENARLKQELEAMRAQGGASAGSASVAGESAQIPNDPVDEFASIVSGQTAPALEAEKQVGVIEPFVASAPEASAPASAPEAAPVSQDAVDAMLASAAAAETSDAADGPLMGSLDTSKMLEEVATLETSAEASDDVLESALDTEKLLSEVDALKSAASADPTPNEDLFGEFKDEEKSQG